MEVWKLGDSLSPCDLTSKPFVFDYSTNQFGEREIVWFCDLLAKAF
jgi:hypothetical protein